MTISIIIPTYNGKHKICNILDSLLNQSYKNFEIIVSIDGSTDGTYEYLKSRLNELTNLVILNHPNKGRSVCRNRGANAASGELLIFLDDDMRASFTLVEEHLNQHTNSSNEIVVGGQIEELSKCKSDIQKYKAHLSRKWSKIANEKIDLPYITAANFSITKELFLKLGSFDERLTDAEDYHLAVIAFENSISIYFQPEILAWHDDFITLDSYIKRIKEYSNAQKRLCDLYPELYLNKYMFRNEKRISTFKKYCYTFFSIKYWNLILDTKVFLLIPKYIRYKLYDFIITESTLK